MEESGVDGGCRGCLWGLPGGRRSRLSGRASWARTGFELTRQAHHAARTKSLIHDAELLFKEDNGGMHVESQMERTWRVGQRDIAQGAGEEAAKGRQEWILDGGPYRTRYTRNGRHLAIAGKAGHVATFDCKTGTLHTELQLQETCRDITFLHDQSHFAVAQKKYVFIYDRDGVELHRLKSHVEPTRLEFLPYHWLLASVGNAGYLKYQDTSTGQLLVEHRTKLGPCTTLTQNAHTAVLYLGHQNGTLSLWTPNLPQPAVQLLAHLGPVVSVSVDPSTGGRYMASAGEGLSELKGLVREWSARGGKTTAACTAAGCGCCDDGGYLLTAWIGWLARHRAKMHQGLADETEVAEDGRGRGDDGGAGDDNGKKQSREEREKRKMRGKGKSMKRYLRKQRKNVIDPTAVAIRTKLEKQKEEKRVAKAIEKGEVEPRKPSALDRFRRS
ncbi:hypothetical protein SERLADRAFT_416377 [Serpula lacrymans var. lacrymans S7.9]|uniref:U three protein 7 n=1 Tax=Serpula lacrymans var. lacrymans (strain S7.9) TaxID=578457 RepID=F8P0Q8_SERL9|nr:uncharacterized protein SERLADRAFT_416377 [Serpula lacrymans var. lacrymans S7.9]EGO22742.1 hypothetical protein SERLADRAFT_416377 [Serpula lacrymans var. lacrymans S7.9]